MKIFTTAKDNESFYDDDNYTTDDVYETDTYIEEEVYDDTDTKGQIALDVLSDDKYVTVVAPVAGIDLDDIDIQVIDNTLVIRGKRSMPHEIYHEDAELKVGECYWGKFMRNVILPENLNFSKIKAIMENNLLVIRIPKIYHNRTNVYIDRVEDIS